MQRVCKESRNPIYRLLKKKRNDVKAKNKFAHGEKKLFGKLEGINCEAGGF